MKIGVGLSISLQRPNSWSPTSLFSAGAKGFWYDPTDLSTLFQDVAGTTPVTAAGQSVALMRDKSGRGNHLNQTVSGNRPVYQIDGNGRSYLSVTGGQCLITVSNIDLSTVGTFTLITGLYKNSDAAIGWPMEFGASVSTTPGFGFRFPHNSGLTTVSFTHRGATATVVSSQPDAGAAPKAAVITGITSLTASSVNIRLNGVASTAVTTATGGGTYGIGPFIIGTRNILTQPFIGRIYSVIGTQIALPNADIITTEAWVNARTGAY